MQFTSGLLWNLIRDILPNEIQESPFSSNLHPVMYSNKTNTSTHQQKQSPTTLKCPILGLYGHVIPLSKPYLPPRGHPILLLERQKAQRTTGRRKSCHQDVSKLGLEQAFHWKLLQVFDLGQYFCVVGYGVTSQELSND